MTEYPKWLANIHSIVPVPKKDGRVRMCVDFRDLNKVGPKEDFPLPHIDILVDNTAGIIILHGWLIRVQSNKDGTRRYAENQT